MQSHSTMIHQTLDAVCGAQVDLMNALQQDARAVTVVGDDAQSIYAFRGAQLGTFNLFKAVYEHANLAVRQHMAAL